MRDHCIYNTAILYTEVSTKTTILNHFDIDKQLYKCGKIRLAQTGFVLVNVLQWDLICVHHLLKYFYFINDCNVYIVTDMSRILMIMILIFRQIPTSGILMLSDEEKRTLITEGYPIPNKLPLTKQEEKNLKKIRRKIKNKVFQHR